MPRLTRIAIGAVLALAVAALPLMLDRCAESCEAHQRTAATAPACHHATPIGAHIAPGPASCGHDHHGVVVTAAKDAAATGPAFAFLVTSQQRSTVFAAAAGARVDPRDSPDSSPPLAGRSLPLRV